MTSSVTIHKAAFPWSYAVSFTMSNTLIQLNLETTMTIGAVPSPIRTYDFNKSNQETNPCLTCACNIHSFPQKIFLRNQ